MKERKLTRLKGYDYSQCGYYFVTICTKDREEWFGKVEDGEMVLNTYGEVARNCWYDLPKHYLNCSLDSFVIVPNHVHGIIVIRSEKTVGNGLKPFPTHDLSEIIRGFKTFSSRRMNAEMMGNNKFHWQKSFYDHVIRNDRSLDNLRQYILNNPLKWELDIENNRGLNIRSIQKSCKNYYKEIIDER
jgi:REP element-mobilizing transposase RayT